MICQNDRGDMYYVLFHCVMLVWVHLDVLIFVTRVLLVINCCYLLFCCHVWDMITWCMFIQMMQMICQNVHHEMLYMLVAIACLFEFILPCLSMLQKCIWLLCFVTCYEMPSWGARCYWCVSPLDACLDVLDSPSCVPCCGAYHLPCFALRWLKLAVKDAMSKQQFHHGIFESKFKSPQS